MSLINAGNLTYLDLARRIDPNGTDFARMAELQTQYNPVLDHIVWQEGNMMFGHMYTSRTALPSLTWRRINQGTAQTKSASEQNIESFGSLTGLSIVDRKLARLGGDAKALRYSEDMAFHQAMVNDFCSTLFYGNTSTNPERFEGLLPRLNTTSGNPAADQMIAGGGSTGADQTSIWLLLWSDETIFCGYPKGSQIGIDTTDMGLEMTLDRGGSNSFPAYRTWIEWDMGLIVKDYRYLSRVHSIDTGDWQADLSAGANLSLLMEDSITAIYNTDVGRAGFYMHRQTEGMLNKQVQSRSSNELSWRTTQGPMGDRRLRNFNEIPIYHVDALTIKEAVVS